MCRLGPTVKVAHPEQIDESRGKPMRFKPEDLLGMARKDYLVGMAPTRNVYLQLCFDRTSPSRAFCGLFAPALSEAWVCFSGLDAKDADNITADVEQLLAQQLSSVLAENDLGNLTLGAVVRAEVSFAAKKSLGSVLQWLEHRLQEVRRRDGGSICVLCAQLSVGELRGLAPSSWVEQRHLRHLTALREMPVCCAPFDESDAQYPALDWPRWISRRFTSKVPKLFIWWSQRLALCRAAGVPICNLPSKPAEQKMAALDALYARQLRQDSQLLWASPTCRPDLGETSMALIDAQERSIDVMEGILQGKDLEEGRGGGQINRPGVYRSVCLEADLKTKICICALQHARYISDFEGGELSKKMIRRVGPNAAPKNTDHTSEVSLTNFESLITMVQGIADVRDARLAEASTLRERWAAALPAEALRKEIGGIQDDGEFIAAMEKAGHADTALAEKLKEVRAEQDAQNLLLDSLYSWLASPTSLMFDAALLRKVHQYMDKVLQLFVMELNKNGCSIIHCSYSRILFATGKCRIIPDVQIFWESLCDNMKRDRILQTLGLIDCNPVLFYGVIWLDPANWAGVPIDEDSGAIIWKAQSQWKIADFLPPAVRPNLVLYAGELLVRPQRELHSLIIKSMPADMEAEKELPEKADCAEDGDACADDDDARSQAGDCMDVDGEAEAEGPAAAAAADAAAATGGAEAAPEGASSLKSAESLLDELCEYILGDFFEDLRRRILHYIGELQVQQQREMPSGVDSWRQDSTLKATDSDASDDEDDEVKREERLRRHLEQKWSFPVIPGRRAPPGALDFEFMRALVQVLQLEECLGDQILALRDRICQKLHISNFMKGMGFENPCFPLILRDVDCPCCSMSSHIDVTSHLTNGPGIWICLHCGRPYDKEGIQARLVDLLETVLQSWQSQEVTCNRCKRLRTSQLQGVCECFGRFSLRFKLADFQLVLKIMRSLVAPHDLRWLGEMLDIYERLV
mmetsp:Transcript_52973/g.93039  ORF Transcript_52973/g.93039 Transcript_52973/m.93039 type:complete len:977 (+) Transcript_52973:45-2975(+)